jgi:integrase
VQATEKKDAPTPELENKDVPPVPVVFPEKVQDPVETQQIAVVPKSKQEAEQLKNFFPYNTKPKTEKEIFDSLAREMGYNPKKPVPNGLTWSQTVETYLKYRSNGEEKFCFGYLYLTGQRVSEALATKRADISIREYNGKEFMVVSSITLKNKTYPHREIAVPMFGKEQLLTENVWKSIENLPGDRVIFPVGRRTIVNWLHKVRVEDIQAFNFKKRAYITMGFRIHPHYLRHTRAGHMAQIHNFDVLKMQKYFGWQSYAMPNYYVHNDWLFLAKQLAKRDEDK